MALGTPLAPTAIGSTSKTTSKPKSASTSAGYAAQSVQGFGSGFPTNTPPPPITLDTYPNQQRGTTPPPTPAPSPTPAPAQPAGTPPPDGHTADGRPYWKNPDNPNQVTFQVPGTLPTRVYNPTGMDEPAIERQLGMEQQITQQNQAMSDWLSGALGRQLSDYTGQQDDLWIQANQFLPAQYDYYGNLIGQEYGNRREGIQLSGMDNEAQRQHAQQAWNLLQSDIGNRRGTTNQSWDETKRYLGQQSGLLGEGWQNTVADINNRRGTATEAQNEALRWLSQQGGFAGRDMELLVDALNDQRGTLQQQWGLQTSNASRLGGEAGQLLDILSGQIGDQRTGARRDIDLARIMAGQQRGTTNTGQQLSFQDAARAREAQDYARQSQSTAAGSTLSRGHRLQLGRNQAAENAARSAANLDWTRSMDSIDSTQQGAENSYVDRLNALNTGQRQANLGYGSTMGGIQHGLDTGAVDLQAALNALETQFGRGQLGYQQTMGGLQNQVNTSNISYQAAMQALQNQYNQGSVGYRGQAAGLQNQMNQGGIDYTAALNSLNNQYGVGGNNYNYAMAQADIGGARIGNQLAGLGVGEQQAQFGNNMNLWNAQQGINQQMSGISQQAAQQWNSYMQQMMTLGLPAPTNPVTSPYGYVPPTSRQMVAPSLLGSGPR